MSKIFMIGDSHAGVYPLSYHKWMDNFKNYFYNFYIPLLKEKSKPGDICIHVGDLFDNRNTVPIDVLNDVQGVVEEISKILPLHILLGNHDIYTKSTNDINTTKIFKYIPNVFIYEETTQIDYNGLKLLLMPWVEKKKDQLDLISRYKNSDILFCHSDLNGARMHLKSVAHKNLDKIDIEHFKAFKKIYSGHIHIKQSTKNFTFIGSIYQMDRNDMNDQKGVFILDTDEMEEEFIPNNISPQFKKINISSEEDVIKLEDIDTSKNYIDLEISNSLLVNSRKIRRKLESIIQKGSFSSIEYLNDIVTLDEEGKEVKLKSVDGVNLENISLTNFESVITEYINNLKFDSEVTKAGVMNEFKEVLNIYNQTYKINSDSI